MHRSTVFRLAALTLAIVLLAAVSRAAVSQTQTGDPWKMLVLVYRGIDVDYTDLDGTRKHLTATMPPQDAELMVKSFLHLPHRGVVYDYTDRTGELEARVVYAARPLTSLTPIGDGYWPSPDDTRPELNAYAPPGAYDSVIVFWQASHPTTDQSIPAFGWGLGGWFFDFTYASVFNLSWIWPSGACDGEVFLHEWLHGVTAFYSDQGFRFPVQDLHGAEEAGYTTDEDGCWRTWLRDYMRGLVYEDGQRTGLTPEAWRSGSITTHNIQGWRGEYFDNETLAGPPVVVRDDPAVWFSWDLAAPHPLLAADHFSSRWTRRLNFAGGAYTFYLAHNDGARLYLDDRLLLDKWGRGGNDSLTAPVAAGPHTLRVEHHEVAGVAEARLYWRMVGSERKFYLPAAFVSK
ncbi:PA14 domain-containing protein [Promineifilum sp.]|uniref:PA14 domain-containing protein n=1 Tax=Promineifilum sp. TaxID=2664178 RepID=UPI0035B26501